MRTICISVIVLFIASFNLTGQCVITLQPGPDDGKDTYVKLFDCNYTYAQNGGMCDTGTAPLSSDLYVNAWTWNSDPGLMRTFIEFNLDTFSNQGCSVMSATLVLYAPESGTGFHCGSQSTLVNCNTNEMILSRVVEPWNDHTVNGLNQPSVAAGIPGQDYVNVPDESDPYDSYAIDITDMVNYWLAEPDSNLGLRLALQAENHYSSARFASSNNANPAIRPKLVLELNCPDGCNTLIQGNIYDDMNGDCDFNGTDLNLENWLVKIEPGPFYSTTDVNGQYQAWVGNTDYTVTQIIPNSNIWTPLCPAPYSFLLPASSVLADTIGEVDFVVQANSYCPDMTVDIGSNFLRKGHTESYYVSYCNIGNVTATNVYIDIEFDPELTPLLSSLPWETPQTGNIYTFVLNTVAPGECGMFSLDVEVSLNVVMDQTLCVEAHIFPDSVCAPVDPAWDKSSVAVEGACSGDSAVCFTIYNTGDPGEGDMQGTSEYRIYEDNILVHTGTFQIAGGDNIEICWTATGATVRLEADQRPGHPGNSHPNANVEICGGPLAMSGQIIGLPDDDFENSVEFACEEVRFSWDPNDKRAKPQGLTDNHYIAAEAQMEYHINFQNTGNDTAFNIVITDTLSPYLDIATIQPGVSSHSCTFRIYGTGILEWTFGNILLPDSNINEPASHGFVKFKANQKPDNPQGTKITNSANIYFDFNDAVITNKTTNIVWKMDAIFNSDNISIYENTDIKIYPNPFSTKTNIDIHSHDILSEMTFEVLDLLGRSVKTISLDPEGNGHYEFDRRGLLDGVYIYRITSKKELVGTGRFVIQ